MLLKYYIIKWFEENRLPSIRANTAFSCLCIIQRHIVENKIGEMDIKDIRTKDIERFLQEKRMYGNKLKNAGLSSHVLKKLRQLIIACLDYAVKEGILDKNYGIGVKFIKEDRKTTRAFTKDERDYFLTNTTNCKYWLIFYMLFYTGCRRSEILGLSWDNVNYKEKTITIEQTLIMVNSTPLLIKNTKTSSSNRTIPLPNKIINMLLKHNEEQNAVLKDKGINNKFNLVFIDDKTGFFCNPMYVSRSFKDNIKRLKMNSDFHIHCTRHTWATMMINSKVSITDVQYLGGWSRPDVLLNIYSHTVKSSHRDAMNILFEDDR